MNKYVKDSIIFVAGLGIGAGISALVLKTIFKKQAEERVTEEVDSMKRYYENKTSEYDSVLLEDEESISKSIPDHVKEALLKDWNRPPLSPSGEYKMSQLEHPMDSDEDEEEISPVEEDERKEFEEAKEYDEYYKKNSHKPPKIISVKDIASFPESFEETEWNFYKLDDVITDENDNVIEDPGRFIGDALDKFDFRNNDEESLYVVSFEFATIYEITKLYISYSDKMARNEEYFDQLKAYGYEEGKES